MSTQAEIPALTIVFPIFNEELVISSLFTALNAHKKSFPQHTEVIFVDDGSSDNTARLLQKTKLNFEKKVIIFSRNFGHQSALLAGMEAARGKYVVTLDSDLQHPLDLIPEMIKAHQRGIDIVLTQRIDPVGTSKLKQTTAQLFYSFLNKVSDQKIQENGSDFRSLNRKALTALLVLKERRRLLRGMIHWIGFSSIVLPYTAAPRTIGESKYTWTKMFKLAVDGVTSFSTVPLYISAVFGVLLFALAALYAVYVIFVRLFFDAAIQGWASILFVQLIVGGFSCLFLGIIGVYIAAIYDEVKQRPNYVIKDQYEA